MGIYINIIALNTPFPPNYGGIIDIYYKLKALHSLGAGIILHCFEYEQRRTPELESICREVHYYRRQTGLLSNLSLLPYNVYSRRDPLLMHNLLANDYPILFEGLHSCYWLNDKRLAGRKKIYRAGNIEHDYYRYLSQACSGFIPKAFHRLEAWKFKRFQPVLQAADIILPISLADTEYLQRAFPAKPVTFIPAFHSHEDVVSCPGESRFILYHAKLSVYENEQVALFLIREVFSQLDTPCVLAGMNPSERIKSAAEACPHIVLEENPTPESLEFLMRTAHIHLLPTFQPTGLKLKLLNSLFEGRHIVANDLMLTGSGLEPLCHIANTPREMIAACRKLLKVPFTLEDIRKREQHLIPLFSPYYQAKKLLQLISNI